MDTSIVTRRPKKLHKNNKRSSAKPGESYCSRCDKYKPISEFSACKKDWMGILTYCKQCAKSSSEKYREQRVEWDRRKNYGISAENYRILHDAQNGLCAICHKPETKTRNGVKFDLCVDHDHVTGQIRGLLCSTCNIGLGHFKDNLELLSRAINYLQDCSARK